MRVYACICVCVCAVVVGLGLGAVAAGPVVQTEYGPIEGVQHDGYKTFTRVPFALPPTDNWCAFNY